MSFRLLALGAKLISDDYVNLTARGKKLLASPPENIAGKLEIRGVGIKTFPYEQDVPVALIISLVPREKVERLPDAEVVSLKGIKVKNVRLHAFDASAPEKILLLLAKK